MVFGLRNMEPAHHENDELCDGATTTNLADEWMDSPYQNSKIVQEARPCTPWGPTAPRNFFVFTQN